MFWRVSEINIEFEFENKMYRLMIVNIKFAVLEV